MTLPPLRARSWAFPSGPCPHGGGPHGRGALGQAGPTGRTVTDCHQCVTSTVTNELASIRLYFSSSDSSDSKSMERLLGKSKTRSLSFWIPRRFNWIDCHNCHSVTALGVTSSLVTTLGTRTAAPCGHQGGSGSVAPPRRCVVQVRPPSQDRDGHCRSSPLLPRARHGDGHWRDGAGESVPAEGCAPHAPARAASPQTGVGDGISSCRSRLGDLVLLIATWRSGSADPVLEIPSC